MEELGEQHHDQHKCITKQSPFPTTWYDFMMSLILPSGTCASASFPPHHHQYFHYLVMTLCRSEPDLKLDVPPRSDLLEVLTVWLGWCTSWASCLYILQDVSSCNNNKDAINALTAKNAAFAKQRESILVVAFHSAAQLSVDLHSWLKQTFELLLLLSWVSP